MKEEFKTIATNKKAWRDYFIVSKLEAGIVLLGTEVKSARDGKVNLKDSYAQLRDGEVFLKGTHIGPYSPANRFNHEPERERKLLLNRHEIKKLSGKLLEKGMTLIPLQFYLKDGKIKVELGLATGKRAYDKRAAIAKRDYERDKEREWKNR